MSHKQTTTGSSLDQEIAVVEWRRKVAVQLGFGKDADEIAYNFRIDIRRLERMIEQGCDRQLALRILR